VTDPGAAPTARIAARVIVADERDAVLLLQGHDPARPDRGAWWFTPGGGIDAGEAPVDAARRELREETGLLVADLGVVRFERDTTFDFEGVTYRQHEHFFAVRTTRFEPTDHAWTAVERRSVLGHRWWTVDELATTDEVVYPEQLVGWLRVLRDRAVPRTRTVSRRTP
jgi:8-oxo-dGTP pyrophosphatase MutT (NUDIX family)